MQFNSEKYLETVLRDYFRNNSNIISGDFVHPTIQFVKKLYNGKTDIPYGSIKFKKNNDNGSKTIYFYPNIREGICIERIEIGYSDKISPEGINSLSKRIYIQASFKDGQQGSIKCLLKADDLNLSDGIASIVIDDDSENRGIYHIDMHDTTELGGYEGRPVIRYYDGETLDILQGYCKSDCVDGEDIQKKKNAYEKMTGLWHEYLREIGFEPDKYYVFDKDHNLDAHALFAKTLRTGSREAFDAWIKEIFTEKTKKLKKIKDE